MLNQNKQTDKTTTLIIEMYTFLAVTLLVFPSIFNQLLIGAQLSAAFSKNIIFDLEYLGVIMLLAETLFAEILFLRIMKNKKNSS